MSRRAADESDSQATKEPASASALAAGRTATDFLGGLLAATPQLPRTLRVTNVDESLRRCTYEFDVTSDDVSAATNNMYGGVYASLTDGLTANLLYAASKSLSVTTDVSVSYFRAAPLGSKVVAHVSVLMLGRTLQHAQVDFMDERGRLLAVGRHSKLVVGMDKIVTKGGKL